jgi:hypothetical protein
MPDQTEATLTTGDSMALKFSRCRPGALLVHIEYLDGAREWIPLDEIDNVRRAFRFVPPEPPK